MTANAQASLRQELVRLRKLSEDIGFPLIESCRDAVSLNTEFIEITDAGGQFLEGLEIPGEARFEDWLREKRNETSATACDSSLAVPTQRVSVVVHQDVSPQGTAAQAVLACAQIGDRLSANLNEFGGITVLDGSQYGTLGDFEVALRVIDGGSTMYVSIVAKLTSTGEVVLRDGRQFVAAEGRILELRALLDIYSNEITQRILTAIVQNSAKIAQEGHVAARSAMFGIQCLFSRQEGAAGSAERHFADANAVAPSSAFYAWQAYLAALYLEECPERDVGEILLEAEENSAKALEFDPYNGLSLALLTHVHAFVFKDFDRAEHYLSRALQIRPDHVMTQDAQALLSLYTGQLDRARAAATRAENMGRFLPFSYCFVTTLGMIETLAGNYAVGARHCERALAMMPRARMKPYPPTLRYLGTCYAQLGEEGQAEQVFGTLKEIQTPAGAPWKTANRQLMPSQDAAELFDESVSQIEN